MFKKGELLVYGPAGIMKLVDVREEDIIGEKKEYYILEDINSKSSSLTYVPCDNADLVSLMRPVIDKKSAEKLIKNAKNIAPVSWENDNRVRAKKFREIIESADHEKLIALIKAIYLNAKERESHGKKSFLLDGTLIEKAENLLYSELSVALGVEKSEILPLFQENSK